MHFLSDDMHYKYRQLKNVCCCYDARSCEWFLASKRQILKWANENAIEDLTITPVLCARSGFSYDCPVDEEPWTPMAVLEINYTMPKDWYVYPELSGKQIKELNEQRS